MVKSPPPLVWIALVLITLVTVAIMCVETDNHQAYRWALINLAGLSMASVILLLLGEMLSRKWFLLVEDELLPAGFAIIITLIMAVPLFFISPLDLVEMLPTDRSGQQEMWFAGPAVLIRLLLFVIAALAVPWLMMKRTKLRHMTGIILLPVSGVLFFLVTVDWVMLRQPLWWSALIPISFVVNQLTGALALTLVYHLSQREEGHITAFSSLASALLTLALLDLWIGFSHFLIAWSGNLPDAARWYLYRADVALPAIILAIIFHIGAIAALVISRSKKVMLYASLSLLAAYCCNALWVYGEFGIISIITMLWPVILWLGWLTALAHLYDVHRGRDAP